MSDDRLHDARQLGIQAADLLNNEAFQKAVERLKNEFVEVWKRSPSADTREQCWQSINMVEKLVAALVSTYNRGSIVQKELNALVQKEEQKKRRLGFL